MVEVSEPVKVAAWKCGSCPRTFPLNSHGKKFAEACCTCRKCGGLSLYMGTDRGSCEACRKKDEEARVEENLARAQEEFDQVMSSRGSRLPPKEAR